MFTKQADLNSTKPEDEFSPRKKSKTEMNKGRLNRSMDPAKWRTLISRELEDTTQTEGSRTPFSLRNFFVSIVLMSHLTVYEKLDILYDLLDWNDGIADGLDLQSCNLLVKTIFERNLYYWPS